MMKIMNHSTQESIDGRSSTLRRSIMWIFLFCLAQMVAGCQSVPQTQSQQTPTSSVIEMNKDSGAPVVSYESLREQIRRDIKELFAQGDRRLNSIEAVVKPRLTKDPELALDVVEATEQLSSEAFDYDGHSREEMTRCVQLAVWVMQIDDMALSAAKGILQSDPGNRLWVAVDAANRRRLAKTQALLDECLALACYGYLIETHKYRKAQIRARQQDWWNKTGGKPSTRQLDEVRERMRTISREVRTPTDLDDAPTEFQHQWEQTAAKSGAAYVYIRGAVYTGLGGWLGAALAVGEDDAAALSINQGGAGRCGLLLFAG